MLLTVAMAGLESRPWQKMLREIERQVSIFDDVEIIIDVDNGQKTSGQKRFEMSHAASGEYIAMVDDDDEVSSNWLASLREGCLRGPDVVTFDLDLYFVRNGRRGRPRRWRFGAINPPSWVEQANHLCAWRRELALRVPWCPHLGYGDDQMWFVPMLKSGLVETELHVDRVLYRYLLDKSSTVNQSAESRRFGKDWYVGQGLRCFWDESGDMLIETRSSGVTPRSGEVFVRDPSNLERVRSLVGLRKFCTVKTR